MKKPHPSIILNLSALAVLAGLIWIDGPAPQDTTPNINMQPEKVMPERLMEKHPERQAAAVAISSVRLPSPPPAKQNKLIKAPEIATPFVPPPASAAPSPSVLQPLEKPKSQTQAVRELQPLTPSKMTEKEPLRQMAVAILPSPKSAPSRTPLLTAMPAPQPMETVKESLPEIRRQPEQASIQKTATPKAEHRPVLEDILLAEAEVPVKQAQPVKEVTLSASDIGEGMRLLHQAEEGEPFYFELFWPQDQYQSKRLYGVLNKCYGMESAYLDGQGNLYFPAHGRGNLPAGFSPLLHQVGAAAVAEEERRLQRLKSKYGLDDSASALRIHRRTTHAALLSGLTRLAGKPLAEYKSISGRYDVRDNQLAVSEIMLDRKPVSGRIILGPASCG
jgi:hypothetical protein